MKEFIEKLIARLEEEKSLVPYNRLLDTIEDKPKEVGQLMTYQRVIEIVNQLAEEYINTSSDTSTGWIPCSERLPDESGEYYTYVCYEGSYIYAVDDIDCDGMVKQWNCVSDYHIIAWKPIAPYKEGE